MRVPITIFERGSTMNSKIKNGTDRSKLITSPSNFCSQGMG